MRAAVGAVSLAAVLCCSPAGAAHRVIRTGSGARYAGASTVSGVTSALSTAEPAPQSSSARELADARSDVVTLETFDNAGHADSWNVDPSRYESEVKAFLEQFR